VVANAREKASKSPKKAHLPNNIMGLKASPTPGGTRNRQDFYRLNMNGKEVLIDAAGLLWQCAAKHATDNFVSGKPHAGTN
jgi:hypothetical protein